MESSDSTWTRSAHPTRSFPWAGPPFSSLNSPHALNAARGSTNANDRVKVDRLTWGFSMGRTRRCRSRRPSAIGRPSSADADRGVEADGAPAGEGAGGWNVVDLPRELLARVTG